MFKRTLLLAAAISSFGFSAQAETKSAPKTCYGECTTHNDFAFWEYSNINIAQTHNINIRGMTSVKNAEIQLALVGGGYERKIEGNLLGIASEDEVVIPVSHVRYYMDVVDKIPVTQTFGKLNLRINLVRDGQVVATKMIDLRPADVNARELDDIQANYINLSEGSSSASLRLLLTNAAQLQCTWVNLKVATYCDPDVYKKLNKNW
ncbi:hypothetical protein [Bdellovibrio bacteriovorus]|uniref:hypothetical protein n=1 Tax=Bdellovibrio bacteriovorus TaxID=959 RepID=UPI0035A5A1C5